jgi:signal-transduction protein with cAMP-binding, CBS, and nucleotidyltransferase domain
MSTDPVTIPSTAGVIEAAQAMEKSHIGDVIVLDESSEMCGIVTDRDIALRVVAQGRDPAGTKLGEVCSRDIASLTPDDTVGDAVRLMTEKAIRRLPVIEEGKPVGIVSLGDLAATEDPESGLADISEAPPND